MSEWESEMTFTYTPTEGDANALAEFMELFAPVGPPTVISLSEDGVGTYELLDVEKTDDGFDLHVKPV